MPGLIATGGAGRPLFWRADPAGHWIWSGPEWTTLTGLSAADSLGEGWLAAVHADDRASAMAPWIDAGAAVPSRATIRIRRVGEEGYDRRTWAASPARDISGALSGWNGVLLSGLDVGIAEAQRLGGDLQHHMRNTLALIRSIARRTARTSETVDHYASHFEGRLDALARIQDAVIRGSDGGVDLEALLAEELLAARVGEGSVLIEGPIVRLRARAAEPLGLALHELVVNAVKFGAFSDEGGAVAIRWSIDADTATPVLHLTWHETGGAKPVLAPRRRGFGTETIEASLPYELNAVTRLAFSPGELRCVLAVPLTDEMAVPDPPP